MSVMTINAGSSSIRFAFYDTGAQPTKLLDGKLERIGFDDTSMTVNAPGHAAQRLELDAGQRRRAEDFLLGWLAAAPAFAAVRAVGHRVVHGMSRAEPARVTPELIAELKGIVPYDPEHMPREIGLMERIGEAFPQLVQVACFDTAFHRSVPRVAAMLPIPRRYLSRGVQRYGFHGLSYTHLLQELRRQGAAVADRGRLVLAHLGNGASLAAVRDGRCIDTSMGFTPASGLVMSTRSGDIDPGIQSFLARTEGLDAEGFWRMVNQQSGLLGVSETSSDMRDLLAREAGDVRAAEAVALFCYQAKKWIGAFAAALGGIDALVFTGGIGENAAPVRARICEGLEFLGIEIDPAANRRHAPIISSAAGRASVRVMCTDEESVIAALTMPFLAAQ